MKNLSRFESVQRPSVAGFLIVLEIVIGPTNSSQSDTIQLKLQPPLENTSQKFIFYNCCTHVKKSLLCASL